MGKMFPNTSRSTELSGVLTVCMSQSGASENIYFSSGPCFF